MTGAGPLLNAKELYQRLGIARSTFYELQRRGVFRRLEVVPAFGRRRYSSVLVEEYLAGQSKPKLLRRHA